MKKILCSFFAALLIVCATVTPALAKGYNDISTTYVRDHYQLLTDSTLQSMEAEAKSLSDTYKCDVYLTIVDDIGTYTVRQYAEAYWNYYDLGRGTNKDGIMFLIAVDSRDYVTITHGQGTTGGITIFTDYRIEQIEDAIVEELKDNYWVAGCEAYLEKVTETFEFYAKHGEPWDSNNDPENAWIGLLIKILVTILVPLFIAAAICYFWASQMKTARLATEASSYLESGSLVLTRQTDHFLRTTRVVTKIEKSDSSSGGGGSTVSDSGFGGSSGGKF